MSHKSYRHTASFGKRQEYIVIADLLRRGFDVYTPLVDDIAIDCVIRQTNGTNIRYLEIQVKARSVEADPKNAGRFNVMDIPWPRENYWFIFYSEQVKTYWVMPSLTVVSRATQLKSGQNKGKYSLNLCNVRQDGAVVPRPTFKEWENAFHLLNEWK